MERAVERLKLQRKVVLVPCYSCQSLSSHCGHNYASLSRIQSLVGIGDGAPNFIRRARAGITRQVRSDEASFAVCHVALRAPGLSKEKPFPAFRIAGEFFRHGLALQGAQVANNCLDLCGSQRTKGRHSSSRDAVLNKTEKSVVRAVAELLFCWQYRARDRCRERPARGKAAQLVAKIRWPSRVLPPPDSGGAPGCCPCDCAQAKLPVWRRAVPASIVVKIGETFDYFRFAAFATISIEYIYTTRTSQPTNCWLGNRWQ